MRWWLIGTFYQSRCFSVYMPYWSLHIYIQNGQNGQINMIPFSQPIYIYIYRTHTSACTVNICLCSGLNGSIKVNLAFFPEFIYWQRFAVQLSFIQKIDCNWNLFNIVRTLDQHISLAQYMCRYSTEQMIHYCVFNSKLNDESGNKKNWKKWKECFR